jgi:uncharacterized protein
MDNSLLATLRMHNPWLEAPASQAERLTQRLPEPFLPRTATLEIAPGRAELVVGPRQAGKSTWIVSELVQQPDPVLVLHAEEPRIRELCRSPALALDELRSVLVPETILVFEEVQHLREAPLFIKGIVDLDPRRRVVVTGSSSFQFNAKTRESLAGRARRTLLLPLSLDEVCADIEPDLLPAIRERRVDQRWRRLLVQGGYPEPWLETQPTDLLHHLAEAFVLKDAADLHTIERPSSFRRLLELAAADVGNLVNVSAWAAAAGLSRNTTLRYLDIAEQAHVLTRLRPFVGGKRAEVTGTPKVFFVDNGLRNTLFGGHGAEDGRADRGALWENAVFGELRKRLPLLDEVQYWRSKNGAEVDFVVRRGDRLVAVEVKAGALARPRISRSSRSFATAYQPRCLAVINRTLNADSREEGVDVLFRRPWEIGEVLARLDP